MLKYWNWYLFSLALGRRVTRAFAFTISSPKHKIQLDCSPWFQVRCEFKEDGVKIPGCCAKRACISPKYAYIMCVESMLIHRFSVTLYSMFSYSCPMQTDTFRISIIHSHHFNCLLTSLISVVKTYISTKKLTQFFKEAIQSSNLHKFTNKQINVIDITFSVCVSWLKFIHVQAEVTLLNS